tara:strand:+ start:92 stop:310 length:219 start_codon:yes stop_codon:yes gene_type:complete
MNEVSEKYLQQMLQGYERNITQLDSAIEQMLAQQEGAEKQKEEMITAISDLRELLGVTDEDSAEDSAEDSEE